MKLGRFRLLIYDHHFPIRSLNDKFRTLETQVQTFQYENFQLLVRLSTTRMPMSK